jgi:hypothetical protein
MNTPVINMSDATDTTSYLTALAKDPNRAGQIARAAWFWVLRNVKEDYENHLAKSMQELSENVSENGESELKRGQSKLNQEVRAEAYQHLLQHVIPRRTRQDPNLSWGSKCDETHVQKLMLLIAAFTSDPASEIVRVRALRGSRKKRAEEGGEWQVQDMVDFVIDLFWNVKSSHRKTARESKQLVKTKERWQAHFKTFREYCQSNLSTCQAESPSRATSNAASGMSSSSSRPQSSSQISADAGETRVESSVDTLGPTYRPASPTPTSPGSGANPTLSPATLSTATL